MTAKMNPKHPQELELENVVRTLLSQPVDLKSKPSEPAEKDLHKRFKLVRKK